VPADAGEAAPGSPETAEADAEEEETEAKDTRIPEVDAAAKINDFAALYGPATLIDEETWDGRVLQWVTVSYDLDTDYLQHLKGRKIKLPLSMIMEAELMEALENYFPIYAVSKHRAEGKTIASKTYTAAERVEKKTTKEIRAYYTEKRAKRQAAVEAQQAAAAEAGGTAAGAGPGAGPGGRMGGGMGGGRMRGGRGM
jgi:hypothetical protein